MRTLALALALLLSASAHMTERLPVRPLARALPLIRLVSLCAMSALQICSVERVVAQDIDIDALMIKSFGAAPSNNSSSATSAPPPASLSEYLQKAPKRQPNPLTHGL